MFCSECGQPARGKFCSNCGFALSGEGSATELVETKINGAEIIKAEIVPDWDHEVCYETILQYPGVRTTIERHAALAPKRMSGEQFLKLADKVIPMGVSMEGVAAVAQPSSRGWESRPANSGCGKSPPRPAKFCSAPCARSPVTVNRYGA